MVRSDDEAVVISGCGWVTPFAVGALGDILGQAPSAAPPTTSPAAVWKVPDDFLTLNPDLQAELKRDKGAWLAALAWEHAARTASLEKARLDSERVGLVLGCSLAGQLGMIGFADEVREQSPRFVSPIHFPQTVGNYIAGALARAYGVRGPNTTLAAEASSSLAGIAEACRLIRRGEADVVFAGGVESLSDGLASAIAVPGVVLSEGACLLVIERAAQAASRGVTPLARLVRWHTNTVAAGCADAPPEDRRREGSVAQNGSVMELVSAVTGAVEGAIMVEAWVGRCPGAAGAMAVAGAVGAAAGYAVPIADGSSPPAFRTHRFHRESPGEESGLFTIRVITDRSGEGSVTLELTA